MAKRHHGEEAENVERWLLTYADMITLLMAFFLMMYAMSIVNMGKFHEMAMSVKSGFGGKASEMSSSTVINVGNASGLIGILPGNYYDLMDRIAGEIRWDIMSRRQDWGKGQGVGGQGAGQTEGEEAVEVTVGPNGQTLTISLLDSPLLFAKGSATLTPAADRLLHIVAPRLIKLPYPVRVEGHTCDLPIHNALFASNWELSAARAMSVAVRLVRNEGFPAERLGAVPYGDTRPVVPNDSEAHRRRNRRVDIVVDATREPPAAAPPQPPPDIGPHLPQKSGIVPDKPNLAAEAVAGEYQKGSTNFDLPAKDEPKDVAGDLDDGFRRRTRAAWGN